MKKTNYHIFGSIFRDQNLPSLQYGDKRIRAVYFLDGLFGSLLMRMAGLPSPTLSVRWEYQNLYCSDARKPVLKFDYHEENDLNMESLNTKLRPLVPYDLNQSLANHTSAAAGRSLLYQPRSLGIVFDQIILRHFADETIDIEMFLNNETVRIEFRVREEPSLAKLLIEPQESFPFMAKGKDPDKVLVNYYNAFVAHWQEIHGE